MQFDKTKTYSNLARSFAGESQAGMRYQLIARACMEQGYVTLADTIKILAKNETEHARRFFEELSKRGEYLENIVLDAGYPFHSGDIGESLKLAADDERQEHQVIYPSFQKDAEEEGFKDIAILFKLVAQVEVRHEWCLIICTRRSIRAFFSATKHPFSTFAANVDICTLQQRRGTSVRFVRQVKVTSNCIFRLIRRKYEKNRKQTDKNTLIEIMIYGFQIFL